MFKFTLEYLTISSNNRAFYNIQFVTNVIKNN